MFNPSNSVPTFRAHTPLWARVGTEWAKGQTRQNVTANGVFVPTLFTVPTVDNYRVGTESGHAPAYNHNTLQLGAHLPTPFSLKPPGGRKIRVIFPEVCKPRAHVRGARASQLACQLGGCNG